NFTGELINDPGTTPISFVAQDADALSKLKGTKIVLLPIASDTIPTNSLPGQTLMVSTVDGEVQNVINNSPAKKRGSPSKILTDSLKKLSFKKKNENEASSSEPWPQKREAIVKALTLNGISGGETLRPSNPK